MKHVLMYSDEISRVEYDPHHPFKPGRGKYLMDLLNRYSLLGEADQEVVTPQPLDEELLSLFHTRYYIDVLRRADAGQFSVEMLEAGLGTGDNPVFPGMMRYSLVTAGGTYQAAMKLLAGEASFAFNPIGGFHHGGKDHAGGFCYVNDIAIAAQALVRQGKRIAYVDIDVHHGNGVESAFYRSNKVLTISMHESGATLFPWSGFENETGEGEGRGFNVNVPLLKGTDDEVYVYAFEEIVPPLVAAFKPDFLFAQVGGDTHRDDPLAHLCLTSNGYRRVIRDIKAMSPRILATGGGGYNAYKTAALWTLAWAEFCGLTPHDHFAGVVGGMMYGPESHAGNLYDDPFVATGSAKDECFAHARHIVSYLKENVFPIHGI
ncbi:MAG: acetoin utilization protein AcuC [Spirochaetes bacterium]|nr:MAG: acetoin utilization protein AcuC [Spirochaetota bacterium]